MVALAGNAWGEISEVGDLYRDYRPVLTFEEKLLFNHCILHYS
jgi:hypothetical protein